VEYQVRTPEKSVSDTATSKINALAADTTAFDTTFREEVATAGETLPSSYGIAAAEVANVFTVNAGSVSSAPEPETTDEPITIATLFGAAFQGEGEPLVVLIILLLLFLCCVGSSCKLWMTVKKHKNQSNFVEVKTNVGAAPAFDLGTHGTNPMQSKSNPILDVGGKGAADSNGPKIEERTDANTGHVYYVDVEAGRTAWTREALVEEHAAANRAKAEEKEQDQGVGAKGKITVESPEGEELRFDI
jgi:hypothetical protein